MIQKNHYELVRTENDQLCNKIIKMQAYSVDLDHESNLLKSKLEIRFTVIENIRTSSVTVSETISSLKYRLEGVKT